MVQDKWSPSTDERSTRRRMASKSDSSLQKTLLPQPIRESNRKWRRQMVSHLVEDQYKKGFPLQTRFLAVHMLDCILGKKILKEKTITEAAAAVAKIAGHHLVDDILTDDRTEFEKHEAELRVVLDFNGGWSSPLFFLDQLCTYLSGDRILLDSPRLLSSEVASYLLEVSLLNPNLIQQVPSVMAAATYSLAWCIVNRAPWTPSLEDRCRHSFEEVHPVMQTICQFRPEGSEYLIDIDASRKSIADLVASKLSLGLALTRQYEIPVMPCLQVSSDSVRSPNQQLIEHTSHLRTMNVQCPRVIAEHEIDDVQRLQTQFAAAGGVEERGVLLERYIDRFSRLWNKLTAGLICSKLPGELRCMIYTQIWDDGYVLDFYGSMKSRIHGPWQKPFVKGRVSNPRDCSIGATPHVADKAYVGEEMAREVVQAYYAVAGSYGPTFEIDEPARIAQLLTQDVFAVGLQPTTALRRLTIDLDLHELYPDDPSLHARMAQIDTHLRQLLDIKRKNGFRLQFNLYEKDIRLEVLRRLLDILRPIVATFEEGSADVSLTWTYDYDGSVDGQIDRMIAETLSSLVRKHSADIVSTLQYVFGMLGVGSRL